MLTPTGGRRRNRRAVSFAGTGRLHPPIPVRHRNLAGVFRYRDAKAAIEFLTTVLGFELTVTQEHTDQATAAYPRP